MNKSKKNLVHNKKRRDFIVLTASAMGVVGAGAALWPFVDSMNPSADVLALASIEIDLSQIPVGQTIKVMWRGKPVAIRHRSQKSIQEARDVDWNKLPDPEPDSARVKPGYDQWLVVIDVCTHLGCIPISNSGPYDGWFCPCHGSEYDTSGRVRRGPAPLNLFVPPYQFITDTKIKIG